MLVLHTSDWHFGRTLHRHDLSPAHEAFVDHLVATVRSERVDLVVVSGDVHDRAIPSIGAIRLFTDALRRIRDAGAAVVAISGNHDGPDRLGDKAALLDPRIQIRTDPAGVAEPVVHTDSHGLVRVYAVPYLEPAGVLERLPADPGAGASGEGAAGEGAAGARPAAGGAPGELDFGDWGAQDKIDGADEAGGAAGVDGPPPRPTHAAVLGRAMRAVRADLARHPGRSIVLAHAWVTSGAPSASERAITVGGTGSVPESLFDGITYTALGHLHRPQAPREQLRYSGSPLAFSFSEATDRKRMLLVELDATGLGRVEEVPLPAHRELRELRGTLDELMTGRAHADAESALVSAVLTDAVRPLDAMATLRRRFPGTVLLTHEPDLAGWEAAAPRAGRGGDDLSVAEDFVQEVRAGAAASAAERRWLTLALDAARLADEAPDLAPDSAESGARSGAAGGAGGAGGAGEAA